MDAVERLLRRLEPGLSAQAGAAAAILLLVVAFAVAAFSGPVRASSVLAAAVALALVGAGLYAWRLGGPGRSG